MTAVPDSPAIIVRHLRKAYGAVPVVNDVSFQVGRGEVVVLLGPSGSGKSTVLRCINFLEEYQGGEIYVDGELVGWRNANGPRVARPAIEIDRLREQVGMVFQDFNLFPHRTALENIMMGPRFVRGMPHRQAAELGRALLDKVGLADKSDAYPARLSGGQQQRVAIARALAMEPHVLLLDEVTSALDPELVDEVLRVVQQLAEEGMTMVIVTHEIPFARDVARQVLFIDHGVVVEQGIPGDLLRTPRSDRLRNFLRRYTGDYRAT